MLKWCDTNTMSDTPRTDAAHEATLTPEYEYEGAEHVAWEFARKLERELACANNRLYEATEDLLRCRESYEKYNLLTTRPFSDTLGRELNEEPADLEWGSLRASITDNDIDKVFAKHWHDRAEYASEGLSNITSAKVT